MGRMIWWLSAVGHTSVSNRQKKRSRYSRGVNVVKHFLFVQLTCIVFCHVSHTANNWWAGTQMSPNVCYKNDFYWYTEYYFSCQASVKLVKVEQLLWKSKNYCLSVPAREHTAWESSHFVPSTPLTTQVQPVALMKKTSSKKKTEQHRKPDGWAVTDSTAAFPLQSDSN